MRFHNLRDLSPARIGVEGLRSHRRGKAPRALIGVKLKELSGAGLAESLQNAVVSAGTMWRVVCAIKTRGSDP